MTRALDQIIERTRREVRRRKQHRFVREPFRCVEAELRRAKVHESLRRSEGGPIRVISEIKFRSPSAGQIHPRQPGKVASIARGFERNGAAAISVLADGPAFGGGVLDVRRAVSVVDVPVLFKGFVLDPVQLDVAGRVGASLVLLLVRCLSDAELERLVEAAQQRGLVPVVEAMDEAELSRALATNATVVGVNARDLGTFQVDIGRAEQALRQIPGERIAVQMSGIRDREGLQRAQRGRADAVLIGEGLMRAAEPALRLRELTRPTTEA